MDQLQKEKLEWLLENKELNSIDELVGYVLYLEDIKKDYEWLKSEVLKTANIIKDLY